VGFEVIIPKAPQKLKGFAESYLLIKDQDDEVERFKGEDFHDRRKMHSVLVKLLIIQI
jgi:hypothetical protein